MEVHMFPLLQIILSVALLVGCGLISAQARGGRIQSDDRGNPQHLNSLPAEIRNAIAPYARVCGGPLAAEHSFARYFQSGNAKLVGLHFEQLRCGNRAAVLQGCRLSASGLHLDRWQISALEEFLCAGA
jgi:hypothetical protein